MLDKVNIIGIVVDHIRTLRNYGTDKTSISDILLFFGVPGVVAGMLLHFYGTLSPPLTASVTTLLSIFAALLFNLLLIVYDVTGRSEEDPHRNKLKQQVLQEVFSNISFAILVAICAIVSILNILLFKEVYTAQNVLSVLTFYLVTLFLLTLLMLLKRVHVLLRREARRE